MREYYRGPLNGTNIYIDDEEVLREDYIISNNELFYKNSFGVLIRDKTDGVIMLDEEVEDYIDNVKTWFNGLECSIAYVDLDKLTYIGKKPEEAISKSFSERVKIKVKTIFPIIK